MATSVSEKPWSDYKESDYTPEQWHNACLIHQHEGAPTSKSQCKLPVKTPDGTLNRAGVHAAAAALAGARGGVDASDEEKRKAKKSLFRLYSELGEKPTDSLKQSGIDALAHYGIKGMKWGVRRSRSQIDAEPASEEAARTISTRARTKAAKGSTHMLTNKELQDAITRMNLERQYTQLTTPPKSRGRQFVGKMLGQVAQQEVSALTRGQQGYITKQVSTQIKKQRASTAS
jgi:hypothetical protein